MRVARVHHPDADRMRPTNTIECTLCDERLDPSVTHVPQLRVPMPDNAAPLRAPGAASKPGAPKFGPGPITAPIHSWFTSPARSHPTAAQAKELPLHLIQLILTYVRAIVHRQSRRLQMSSSDADQSRSSTML